MVWMQFMDMAFARAHAARGSRRGLASIRSHHFLADGLGPRSIVLDLGAHLGEFSQQISQAFGCRCYAIEANPELCDRIATSDAIQKVHCAIGAFDGPVSFTIDRNPESGHLSSDGRAGLAVLTVAGRSLESLMQLTGINTIDLLKVDIEGAEFELFDSLSDAMLETIPQITVEFHDFRMALDGKTRVDQIKRRLVNLGFACIVFSRVTNGDVLFVNRRHFRMSRLRWFYTEKLARYVRGVARMVRRFPTAVGRPR